jgi:hypothetical protein
MFETEIKEREGVEQARARFWANYQALGGRDRDWFDQHVPSLVKIATQDYGPVQPWYMSITPIVAPPVQPRRQRVREKILVVSLAKLSGTREPVGLAL